MILLFPAIFRDAVLPPKRRRRKKITQANVWVYGVIGRHSRFRRREGGVELWKISCAFNRLELRRNPVRLVTNCRQVMMERARRSQGGAPKKKGRFAPALLIARNGVGVSRRRWKPPDGRCRPAAWSEPSRRPAWWRPSSSAGQPPCRWWCSATAGR